jgi:hypothetical protein
MQRQAERNLYALMHLSIPAKKEMLTAADDKRHTEWKCVFPNEHLVPLYRRVPCEDKLRGGLR